MSQSHSSTSVLAKDDNVQESFLLDCNQDDDIPPQELSGDESAERSLLLSDVQSSKANFLLTVTTIMKTVIGAGILSLPFTVSKLGYAFSMIVFALVMSAAQFSSVLLLHAKNLSRHSNYSTILYHIFHHRAFKALGSVLILLNNLGVCIAELTIFKATIRKIMVEKITDKDILDQFYTSEIMIILCIALLELPLTLVKKIEKLKFFAFFGVAGILVFVVCLVVHFFVQMAEWEWQLPVSINAMPTDWFRVSAVIPNLLLALSYQMNYFPIYKGMVNSNDAKMNKASLAGIGACSLAYLIVGILGYSLYGSSPDFDANFLLALPIDKINTVLFFGMNLGFLISVLFSFPVMFFGARNNFIAIAKLIFIKSTKQETKKWRQNQDNIEEISSYIDSDNIQHRRKKANILFLVYTFVLYAIVIVVAILVEDIESVFNIVGAVCSTSIGVILPALFYFRQVDKKGKERTWKYYLSLSLFVVMIPYALFSIVASHV